MMWLVFVALAVLLVARLLVPPSGKSRTVPASFDLYVINLDRAPSRMRQFVADLSGTDLADAPLIRVRATDGARLDLASNVTPEALQEIVTAERVGYRQRHYELTRGAVGCYLSHMDAWQRLAGSDKEQIMVCEDDAVLDPDIGQTAVKAMREVPTSWDIILLGYWCVKCETATHWRRMYRFFGLHCYLVRRSALQKVQEYTGGRVGQQFDSLLSDMCEEGRMEVYGVKDKAALQSGSRSSVQVPLRTAEGVDPWAALPAVRAIRSLTAA